MSSMRHACLAAVLVPTIAAAAEVPVWFGTYTGTRTGSEGIYVARFDTETGALSTPVLAVAARNPSFLTFHPRLPMLYAVSEISGDDGPPEGAIEAFAIDEATGSLASRGAESTGGAGPCHVTVDTQGRVVLAANYGGGSVACLGLTPEGRLRPLASGSGLSRHPDDRMPQPRAVPGRQDKPHAHSVDVIFDRAVVSCDLGLNQILIHRLDPETATLEVFRADRVFHGRGPRHLALHPSGSRAWCVNELDLSVTGFTYGPRLCWLTEESHHSTLPADVTDRTGFTCAEIAVHPGGGFVYVSNRGHDSIAMFRIVNDTTDLELLGTEPTRARTPRHFAIAPGGSFLLVGGQASNVVTVFAIDVETGRLSFTGTSVDVPSPVCVAFRPLRQAP